ncbi:MAG: precorrin-6A reductase [archaeon]|nr:precorrin-6A reductase [archaeon]
MTYKVLVFAGTTEGGAITDLLANAGIKVHACLATDYGRTSVRENPNVEVSSHPLAPEVMRDLMREYPVVVDATHPYATRITGHIKEACADTGAEYIRLRRPESDTSGDDVICVDTIDAAVEFLKGTEGNILATTGSKELAKYTAIPGFKERVFARVLSTAANVADCVGYGFEGRNLFAMQGPFCEELDYGMMVQVGARYLVTKDSGTAGGFSEKVNAARRAGARIVLVGRPPEDPGMNYEETARFLAEKFGFECPARMPRILSIIGTGVGPGTGLTSAGADAVRAADLVVGADRMLQVPEAVGKRSLNEYSPSRIFDYLSEHPEFRNIALLVSGDIGFYSATRSVLSKVDSGEYEVRLHCGISSVQYLCARAGVPWQDVCLISAHGKTANIVGNVRRNSAVFSLLTGKEGAMEMCQQLIDYNLSDVKVAIGCDLGYPEERFVYGSPEEILSSELGTLCAALVFNPHPDRRNPISIPDSEFVRGDAPMTKSEIRALSVAKLKLQPDSVVYDIGAGTGSVTVEMALVAVDGMVYAVEKEEAAADLIDVNRRKFGAPNISIIRGLAPEAMRDLPAPTHVFIGGSSGNLKEIVNEVLSKNPLARIIVNSVTLETIAECLQLPSVCAVEQEEIVCVNAANSRHLGRYNLMTAQNPVYIAVFRGKPQ